MIGWLRGAGALTAALCLAAVLVWAAVAKLRSRERTADDFASLGLAGSEALAVAVPAVELAVAGLLVVAPGWGGPPAFALLAAFTLILARVLAQPEGLRPSCACFGGAASRPISIRHLVRNGALLILAALASLASGSTATILG